MNGQRPQASFPQKRKNSFPIPSPLFGPATNKSTINPVIPKKYTASLILTMKHSTVTTATALLIATFLPSSLLAQAGDAKAKGNEKDLIANSTNWRQWATEPAPVFTPEESLKQFQVAPGFRIELVAAAPLIKDPVFAEWDMSGRLWVCEFQSYMRDPDSTGEQDIPSRVVVLEDTNGDGKMDKSTTFLDDIINPRSVSIVADGALVATGEGTLLYCQDTNGDLVCDKRTKLIDFATAAKGNIEHAENGLHFAIDNWMYNSKSSRRLRWQNKELTEEKTKGRGQWGFSSYAYCKL